MSLRRPAPWYGPRPTNNPALGLSGVPEGSARCQEPGALVLVAGATGGVGQLLTAKLLEVRWRLPCAAVA